MSSHSPHNFMIGFRFEGDMCKLITFALRVEGGAVYKANKCAVEQTKTRMPDLLDLSLPILSIRRTHKLEVPHDGTCH